MQKRQKNKWIRGMAERRRAVTIFSASANDQQSAVSTPSKAAKGESEELVESMIEFLKEDLTHLFDEQGIDASKYDDEVEFEDPITKYSSISGYKMNIQFLKNVFDPKFILRDIKQTGKYEITTRWTMTMKPTFANWLPTKNLWNPELTFTGTSIMGINPETGKFNKHVDTWDAVKDQRYFSTEAFIHMLSQVADVRGAPANLEKPPYDVLLKRSDYEVREYPTFTVAETENGAAGFTAFGALAGYIFGRNKESVKMDMTTPVFSTKEKMQFYLDRMPEEAPAPTDSGVEVKNIKGQVFAVSRFGGIANEDDGERQALALQRKLERDDLQFEKEWVLARYNDPGVLPPFRRNEILVPLKDFNLPSVL